LKFRAESDVHWPQVVLQNLSILVWCLTNN
jgi:hypothetical protein